MKAGIYKIINRTNNKFYVGRSCDVKNRLDYHKRALGIGNHPCKEMQKDYKKTGFLFSYEIIEKYDEGELQQKEKDLIEELNATELGYKLGYNTVKPTLSERIKNILN